MRYYLVAGEASGDLHGANLILALKALDARAEFRAWGGDRMAAAGADLVHHVRELAFMGFWEVAVNLRQIMGLLGEARNDVIRWKPDALILIDYPGFNLRLAGAARKAGLKVIWYISPQVWAWKAGRVKTLKERVHQLYAILPFEPEFYARYGMTIFYVGHPLLDELQRRRTTQETAGGPPQPTAGDNAWIALLPGSRKQELDRMLPIMLDVARKFPQERFALAGLGQLGESAYTPAVLPSNVKLYIDQTYDVLEGARAALVTSGTATLETALFGVPEVVLYRGNAISYFIARRLVSVPFISLVNLVLNRPLIAELLQGQVSGETVERELRSLLEDPAKREQIRNGYAELFHLLGGPGASERVATGIIRYLNQPADLPACNV